MNHFTIRSEVFETFQEKAKERFEDSLAQFLKENVPDAKLDPPEELRVFVGKMVRRAGRFGLTAQRDAAIYTTCAYLLGTDFELHFHPALRTLRSALSGPDKAKWLADATVALIQSGGKVPS